MCALNEVKGMELKMYKKLKELRKSFGYSCNYMGQKIGVTGTYYYFIESGKRGLSYNNACKIAQIFNLKPDDIFFKDHNNNSVK